MRLPSAFLVGLLCLAAPRIGPAEEHRSIELKDGDRVVFLGDTFIERGQRYGYLETFLTLLNPEKDVTFRNLGWSGDTVGGVSRAGFDPPEAGFELDEAADSDREAHRGRPRLWHGRLVRR